MKKIAKLRKYQRQIIVILLLIVLVVYTICSAHNSPDEITYSEVISSVNTGEVSRVEIDEGSSNVVLTLTDGSLKQSAIPNRENFSSFISDKIENGSHIVFEVKRGNSFIAFIASFIIKAGPTILLIFLFSKIILKGNFEIAPETSSLRFSDVAGIDEERAQLEQIVQFLKEPERFTSIGARIPKGILFYGSPGTGKTLLAKAIAGEANVPFFQISASSFEEMYVGLGALKVRKLFKTARKHAPCIIFIDEIDAVAQARYNDGNHSHSEQTLNQLLSEMDGFCPLDRVIVIAATNHFEVIDSALKRPGRFDRSIFIPMPDALARKEILQVHARNKSFSADVSLAEVAQQTVGFSGAELENLLNEAAILSVNSGRDLITRLDISEAFARVRIGLEKKNSVITITDRYLTAVHEAGHAIVSAVVRPNTKIFGISIIPRGRAGGYNLFDDSDEYYQKKDALLKFLQVTYGGRAAEILVFNNPSSGAANDLQVATKLAYQMVNQYAMADSENIMTAVPELDGFNNELRASLMNEIQKICRTEYDNAFSVVKSHEDALRKLAKLLLEKETLSQEEVANFMQENI